MDSIPPYGWGRIAFLQTGYRVNKAYLLTTDRHTGKKYPRALFIQDLILWDPFYGCFLARKCFIESEDLFIGVWDACGGGSRLKKQNRELMHSLWVIHGI